MADLYNFPYRSGTVGRIKVYTVADMAPNIAYTSCAL